MQPYAVRSADRRPPSGKLMIVSGREYHDYTGFYCILKCRQKVGVGIGCGGLTCPAPEAIAHNNTLSIGRPLGQTIVDVPKFRIVKLCLAGHNFGTRRHSLVPTSVRGSSSRNAPAHRSMT